MKIKVYNKTLLDGSQVVDMDLFDDMGLIITLHPQDNECANNLVDALTTNTVDFTDVDVIDIRENPFD